MAAQQTLSSQVNVRVVESPISMDSGVDQDCASSSEAAGATSPGNPGTGFTLMAIGSSESLNRCLGARRAIAVIPRAPSETGKVFLGCLAVAGRWRSEVESHATDDH